MGNVSVTNELSSRPERSVVEGPAVPSTSIQFDRKTRLFIRSAAEGSAVPRTIPGKCFSREERTDLRLGDLCAYRWGNGVSGRAGFAALPDETPGDCALYALTS